MRKSLTILFCLLAAPASAECVGRNLIEALPDDARARLETAVEGVPYRDGLFWKAEKDGMEMVLIGTYHFTHPRHHDTVAAYGPLIDDAHLLLVEAGPEEMERMTQAMTDDPTMLTDPDGPTLLERMGPEQWEAVSRVLADRGIPGIFASKMRPWYVAMMMGISPCMLKQAADAGGPDGLDQMLIDRAQVAGTPVAALEPWDTVFTLFTEMTPQEEIDMILFNLPAADHADDYAQTLIDAYFAEDVWSLMEFARLDALENGGLTPEQVDAQFAIAEDKLMVGRNRDWIGRLTDAAGEAAARDSHVVAGFGALHMPGEDGVLNLLDRAGWTLTRLPSPVPQDQPEEASDP